MPVLFRSLLTLVLVIPVCGCGGESEVVQSAPPPPPPPPPGAAPAAAMPPAEKSPQATAAPTERERPQRPAPRRTATSGRSAHEEANAYLVGQRRPKFLATRVDHPYGVASYRVTRPAAGIFSSSYRVTRVSGPGAREINRNFRLPDGFSVVNEAGYTADGIPLRIRCEADDALMAYVPPGVFMRGTDGDGTASPVHPVYVDGFYMDVHEVTLQQYARFRKREVARRPQPPLNEASPDDFPAAGVTWRDAALYAAWAKKELPREAEWEYAGRTAENLEYPWGSGRAIWSRRREPGQVDPVGSFRNDRSRFGIYDLAGNLREWCDDFYDPRAYQRSDTRTADGSPVRNPTGPDRPVTAAGDRVARGGGTAGWELWRRDGHSMRSPSPEIGFRCVLRVTLPVSSGNDAPNATF